MVMQIRVPPVWLDSNGNPAAGFQVYIAQPNTDPRDSAKQLALTDSASGEVVSNPFTINPEGYPKNNNGEVVLPIIQEQEYSVLMVSPGGGIQYPYPSVKSDAFGIVGGGSGVAMVDAVYNNFPAAQAADLTDLRIIFIQSKTSGWEGTASGPSYPYYAAYTGGIGPAGTGAFDLFYDSEGNEWKITENSQLPLTNEDNISTNAAAIAVNTGDIADNASNITSLESLTRLYMAGNWQERLSISNTNFRGLSFGLDKFVCVGSDAVGPLIYTSLRGIKWVSRTPVGTDNLTGVTNNGVTFVAGGANGRILTSANGIAWVDRPNGMSATVISLTYGAGLFIAAGALGGASGEIWTSPDGVTWTQRVAGTAVVNDNIVEVIFDGGLFVAVGGSTLPLIRTSPDGIIWTTRAAPVEVPRLISGVTWDGDRYVAISKNVIISSQDGISWSTIATLDSGVTMTEVSYGSDLFLMTGDIDSTSENVIYSSDNAIDWSNQGEQTNFTGIDLIYESGVFISCGANGISTSLRAWSGS